MAGDFERGAVAAQEANKNNPFSAILGSFQNAQARRYAEDQQRKKEEAELSKALQVLSYQKTYENELQKAKAEEERRNILSEGQAQGKITETSETGEGTFEGTPFGAMGKRFKINNTQTPVFLVDPTTGELKQAGSTPKGAKVIQEKSIDTEVSKKELMSQAQALPKLEQALQSVTQLEDLFYKGATPDTGAMAARITGPFDVIKARSGFNPNLNSYLNNRKAFAGLIAKGGFGEAGILTNQDIERVVSALPSASSTKEEAKIGFQEVKILLQSARDRFEKRKQEYSGRSGMKQPSRNVGKSGGQVMVDANGNRAMVYSDGSYEEM